MYALHKASSITSWKRHYEISNFALDFPEHFLPRRLADILNSLILLSFHEKLI
jgi:hypothetical protein